MSDNLKVAVIGTGYVGLVSGACFAKFGNHVTCVDIDAAKIEHLQKGEIPIFEPGLKELVEEGVDQGLLFFDTNIKEAVRHADAVFIAVGTPPRADNGHADLQYVHEAARQIGTYLTGYTVIVDKSTVPVGTARVVASIIQEVICEGAEFDVVSNPEFLREGAAILDFCEPDRIIVGAESGAARDIMRGIYKGLTDAGYPLKFTGIESAELIKYAANAFLATKITFINEMADLCEHLGADIAEVSAGIGMDSRIGSRFLQAGPGYGGSCFPKDTLALATTAKDAGRPASIVETVIGANDLRKKNMAQKTIDALGGDIAGKKIAVLGVTFKANTDDMRDAPSLDIIPLLQDAGGVIHAYDPEGMENAASMMENILWENDPLDMMQDADAALLLTEWPEFKSLDWVQVGEVMRRPVLVDLRNLFTTSEMLKNGFEYHSIGRPTVLPV